MVFFPIFRYTKTTAMHPFILFIILQNNTCPCTLNMNGAELNFKSDTMKLSLTKGNYKLQLICANGWWINININHDGNEKTIRYLPIDTKNQKLCKKEAVTAGIISPRLE